MTKVLSVVGNRPQFIKSAPLSVALREAGIDEVVLHTGQHWDPAMSQVFFDELGLAEPRYRLDLRTSDPQAMTPPIREVIEAERPDWVLVYGDTNSTLAGAHAAGEEVPIAHVEAGLRSFDLSMPEERNRIEVDRLSALLFCPDERSAAQLEQEGVPGRREVVGDVMADATRLFAPLARRLEPPQHEPPYTVADDPPRGEHRAGPAARDRRRGRRRRSAASSSRCIRARGTHSTSTVSGCPRTSRRSSRSATSTCSRSSPRRDAVVTDSGGLQKEAYWLRVPCVTMRPSTEWVDTVDGRREPAGDEPAELARARGRALPRRRAGALRRRPCDRTHRSRSVRLIAVPEPTLYDVAVVGAGYVGLPLAVTFAEAGGRVLILDVQPRARRGDQRRDEPHRGRHLRAPRSARRRRASIIATRDYEQVKHAHAVLIALPTPLTRQREPDLSYVERAATSLAPVLQRGQVVVLESTT